MSKYLVTELRALATQAQIPGRSKMNKAELLVALGLSEAPSTPSVSSSSPAPIHHAFSPAPSVSSSSPAPIHHAFSTMSVSSPSPQPTRTKGVVPIGGLTYSVTFESESEYRKFLDWLGTTRSSPISIPASTPSRASIQPPRPIGRETASEVYAPLAAPAVQIPSLAPVRDHSSIPAPQAVAASKPRPASGKGASPPRPRNYGQRNHRLRPQAVEDDENDDLPEAIEPLPIKTPGEAFHELMLRASMELEKSPLSFLRFMRWLNVVCYARHMQTSGKYTVDEMLSYEIEEQLEYSDIVVDFFDGVRLFYELYNPGFVPDDEKLEGLAVKYVNYPGYFFQRLYQKYLDPTEIPENLKGAYEGEMTIMT